MKETRIYLVDLDHEPTNFEGSLNPAFPNSFNKEIFISTAEKQGTVFSIEGFQQAFNNDEINATGCYIFIEQVEIEKPRHRTADEKILREDIYILANEMNLVPLVDDVDWVVDNVRKSQKLCEFAVHVLIKTSISKRHEDKPMQKLI